MKKTIQIQDGLVAICGPMASGKTTLAQRIMDEAPYSKKTLLSTDAKLKEFLRIAGLPEELFQQGIDQETHKRFAEWFTKILQQEFKQQGFIVYEGLFDCTGELLNKLCLLPLIGFCKPITIIKMFPKIELHAKFVQSRQHSQSPLTLEDMRLQRVGFNFLTRDHLFNQYAWVREYLVMDPIKLCLEFIEPGQSSKELWAATIAGQIYGTYKPQR